ncbi:MAG: nucleotidyltransferase domain-containing protein [Spirochaetes bacterium]|nr:MAG: nucleotidyltransferase domain-containing protein [Spirochaetota bacterium]
MRLKNSERDIIKRIINNFDPDSRVFLFGSRTDDRTKGGDIDLLIFTERNTLSDKLKLAVKLKEKLGDRKIDIILTGTKISAENKDPFISMITEKAMPL